MLNEQIMLKNNMHNLRNFAKFRTLTVPAGTS